MHYNGNIYRPPTEANSVLLQLTHGCSHNNCTFCRMYKDVDFKVSPLFEIEEDLKEIKQYHPDTKKIFLLNGDAMALSFEKLKGILKLINYYLPNCKTISSFARITNLTNKSIDQLNELCDYGLKRLYVGFETGDDITLKRTKKGYTAVEALTQFQKLDKTKMEYFTGCLLGLAGKGNGERNALESAKIINQTNPVRFGVGSLSLYTESDLAKDPEFEEAGELEKLYELRTLLENLEINGTFEMTHLTNQLYLLGRLPDDKDRLLLELNNAIESHDEALMKSNRERIVRLGIQ